MAFVDVDPGAVDPGLYWKPNVIGEFVEGNVAEFIQEEYEGRPQEKILLEIKEGEFTELPSHKHLVKYHKNLKVGDYIRVTVTDVISPTGNMTHPMLKYRVQLDDERFVSYQA